MNISVQEILQNIMETAEGFGLKDLFDPEAMSPYSTAAVACAAASFFLVALPVSLRRCGKASRDNSHISALASIHYYSGSPPETANNKQCIELLLKYPDCVNKPISDDQYLSHGYTPFLRACWNNNFDLIQFMLKSGADVNLTNSDGESAMYLVAYRVSKSGNWDPRALNLLWNSGCSVDDVNVHSNSMLHLAAKAGNATLTRWLLLHGAEPHVTNQAGYTPHKLALKKGSDAHMQVARLLNHPVNNNIKRHAVVRSDGLELEVLNDRSVSSPSI